MRVLILSDIHANLEALEAVLGSAPRHDAVWNLGDVVGYGANPNEVVDRARRLGAVVVRGNHDRASSGLTGVEDFSQDAGRAALWTQSVLSSEHREWLRGLAAGPVFPQVQDVCCVHGSPIDEDEYLISATDAWPSLDASPARITFFGHTHRQGGFATNGEEYFQLKPQYSTSDEAEDYEQPLRTGARYLLNPGSVGQPRDRDWRAGFAIYDDVQALITWHRVPYNAARAQLRIREAGLPPFLADRLQKGI